MKIEKVCNDPAIVDFYIDELGTIDFNELFSGSRGRNDYGDLGVYEGREVISPSKLHHKITRILESPVTEITKILLDMDVIRYPKGHVKQFFNSKSIGIQATVDSPNWSMPWHLDNQFIAVSGMINARDNETQTYFSKKNHDWSNGGTDFSDCEIIHKGQNKKLWGTAWLNTENTWHCVPRINTERHVLLFNVFFFK